MAAGAFPLFLLAAAVVSTTPATLLLAGASCEPERCGKVIISAPFGVVSGSDENRCAQMSFQVTCTDGVPYLGYYQRKYGLRILEIFYGNGSLLVSDLHKLEDFNLSGEKGCHVPTANTATKIGPPFSISPLNQNLIFYNCTKPLAPAARAELLVVETVCRNNTFVRAGGRYNSTGVIAGSYGLPGCNATTVPVLGATGKVNASDYQQLISDGFQPMLSPIVGWYPGMS